MKRFKEMEMIQSIDKDDYIKKLNKVLTDFTVLDLEVEVSHAMCPVNRGLSYMYSAVVIGRRE